MAVDTLILTGEVLQKFMVGLVVDQLAEIPGTLKAKTELSEGAVRTANEFNIRWPNDPVVAVVAVQLTVRKVMHAGGFS